jgi:hypothetical protein
MSLDTTNWAKFPVSVDGVDFVSEIDPDGSFYPQLSRLPQQAIQDFHEQMIHELIGNPSLLSRQELLAELERVNDGAQIAVLALA